MRQLDADADTLELNQLAAELAAADGDERVRRLVTLARRLRARDLLTALHIKGEIRPRGQGCGWEGHWSVESPLWPVDREQLLGQGHVAAPRRDAATEEARLLPWPPQR